jgi:hypothetical protein
VEISSKFCPVCKNKNDIDAMICIHCGASLENFFTDAALATRNTEMQTPSFDRMAELAVDDSMIPENGIAIYVEGVSKPVFLYSSDEFVMGRRVGETAGILLDLSPLGGYHMGLSRRHALIQRTDHGYGITDLGSSNGTWVNQERLKPHKAYPLASGSQIRLARMRFLVVYRTVRESA